MTIISKTFGLPSQVGVAPRRVQLVTTDNLATVTSANYLTQANLLPDSLFPTDIIDMVYSFNTATGHGTYGEFLPTIVGNTITLHPNAGQVIGTTIPNHLIVSTDTTGSLANLTGTAINNGSIQAGSAGIAGTLISMPSTANNGKLVIQANNSTNNITTTVTSSANTINQTITIPDAASSASNFLISSGTQLMASGSAIVLDKQTDGNAPFVCNANAGVLTTTPLAIAGGAVETIPWTNSFVTTTSVIFIQIAGGTNTVWDITITAVIVSNGNIVISIYNNSPDIATEVNGTIIMNFVVF